MLTRDAFWALIGTLGGAIDQERAQALTDRLAEQSPADIVAFADHLAQVLHELDSPERAEQLVVDWATGRPKAAVGCEFQPFVSAFCDRSLSLASVRLSRARPKSTTQPVVASVALNRAREVSASYRVAHVDHTIAKPSMV